jgi:hypothetical protein
MIDSMSLSQEYALYSGREINKDLVLISHPRIILISLSLPSACSFFDEIKSFLGMMSLGDRGLASVLIASGIARATLDGVSPCQGRLQ